jgi:DNA-binding NarL/FixJ family response regulator
MASVPNLAVAPAYVEPLRADLLDLVPPAVLPADPLADLWDHLVRGRLRFLYEGPAGDRMRFVAQITFRPHALCADEEWLARSILGGAVRKEISSDLDVAISTVTGRYLRALAKLDLNDCTMPLVLALAALSRSGVARIATARSTYVDQEGRRCLSVTVPRPVTSRLTALTPVQQQVAQWLIEGGTRETIAERRGTSVHTVAGQVHAVFHALRVTGRFAVIRRASELGCFGQPALSVA